MTTVETGMDDVDTMKGSATSIPTAGFVDKERLPESLSYTLDYIVGQVRSIAGCVYVVTMRALSICVHL
jgi:hypothetical protein